MKKSEFERGYERGIKKGQLEGYEFLMVIILCVLKDKHDFSDEDIWKVKSELDSYTDMIRKGYFKFEQMKAILLKEYNIKFRWEN